MCALMCACVNKHGDELRTRVLSDETSEDSTVQPPKHQNSRFTDENSFGRT